MRTVLPRDQKPIKGNILAAHCFRWETAEPKFVVCVTGFIGHISYSNSIRTSWVEATFEKDGKRFIETRNSVYQVDMDNTTWKVLQDELKHADLDVERMKR